MEKENLVVVAKDKDSDHPDVEKTFTGSFFCWLLLSILKGQGYFHWEPNGAASQRVTIDSCLSPVHSIAGI